MKIIISGGGTGGHIFPAISIAQALENKIPQCEILFIGAKHRMEMQKVPEAGYKIIGLPVKGMHKKISLKNFGLINKLIISLVKAGRILNNFKPNVVVGVGGFASAPVLYMAGRKKIPVLIQEQNSYAGKANKYLAKYAQKICVAYQEMDKYFPAEKIIVTGNPVRKDILQKITATEAFKYFNLNPTNKTILVIGGSLGAKTINTSIAEGVDKLIENGVQVLWQTGKYFIKEANEISRQKNSKLLFVKEFIKRMDYAYRIADVVISRAGAGTISELCLAAKPVILIPSPNVADDHQTKNADALVKNEAAVLVTDNDAPKVLINKAIALLKNEHKLSSLRSNIRNMAYMNSDERIADEIINIATK